MRSRESPFANSVSSAPGGGYLSSTILIWGAPAVETALMGLTSYRRITIAENLARGWPKYASSTVRLRERKT
jgi:hypothetical protein